MRESHRPGAGEGKAEDAERLVAVHVHIIMCDLKTVAWTFFSHQFGAFILKIPLSCAAIATCRRPPNEKIEK